ncbi:hypothetical protein D3C81_2151520 [compost metagenome]
MQRQAGIDKIQGAGQGGGQLHLSGVAEHLPPTRAEQGLQRFQTLQLQMMAVLAQALQQGAGEGRGKLQPVALADVRRPLLHRVAAAQ